MRNPNTCGTVLPFSCADAEGSAAYWEDRARRYATDGDGLRAVCSYGMPGFYNAAIHHTQRLALSGRLDLAPGMRVLDAGCGVGRWSIRLARRGVRVTGIDLSRTMVLEARRRASLAGVGAICRFAQADLAELDLGERFPRILGVTVLQHILDGARFEGALGRLADHLEAGGRMVLLEAAPARANPRCNTTVFHARTADEYLAAFSRLGLRCVDVGGVDPAPFKILYLPHYRRLPHLLARSGLAVVTAASLPIDVLAGRSLVRASWHKVFVLEREPR
jgi:2-polyprenyl-3-methyl-5-hydroxy-6-metoxy-1,4-benzoquinol methylase